MIKQFIKDYFWFWKESFSYMKGHNRLYITWGCFIKAIPFCIEQQKYYRLVRVKGGK